MLGIVGVALTGLLVPTGLPALSGLPELGGLPALSGLFGSLCAQDDLIGPARMKPRQRINKGRLGDLQDLQRWDASERIAVSE